MIVPPEWWTAEEAREDQGFWARAARVVGLRRPLLVDGVTFLERGGEPLRRALSERGKGFKDYSVEFPSGEPMRIRATAQRYYPDVVGQRMPVLARVIESLARPGMRVLILNAGTGQAAAWTALCVGASGGVVALERDGESVRFSRRRYPAANISFEIGGVEALSGELDGAFEGVLALGPVESPREAWRVVAEGGWMLTGDATFSGLRSGDSSVGSMAEAVAEPGVPVRLVLLRKPRSDPLMEPKPGEPGAS